MDGLFAGLVEDRQLVACHALLNHPLIGAILGI